MLIEIPVSVADMCSIEHERTVYTQFSPVAKRCGGVGEQCFHQLPADDMQSVGAVADRYVLHERYWRGGAEIEFHRWKNIRQVTFSKPLAYARNFFSTISGLPTYRGQCLCEMTDVLTCSAAEFQYQVIRHQFEAQGLQNGVAVSFSGWCKGFFGCH